MIDDDHEYYYPTYQWHNASHEMHDAQASITCNAHDQIDAYMLTKYTSTLKCTDENNKQQRYQTRTVPYDMWFVMAKWINGLKWTNTATAKATTKIKLPTTVSWVELTLAFQYQTGYDIINTTTPIIEQRACFKAAFAKLIRTAHTTDKNGNILKQQLQKDASIMSAKPHWSSAARHYQTTIVER